MSLSRESTMAQRPCRRDSSVKELLGERDRVQDRENHEKDTRGWVQLVQIHHAEDPQQEAVSPHTVGHPVSGAHC